MRRAALFVAGLVSIAACESTEMASVAGGRSYEATLWIVYPDKGMATDQIAEGSSLTLTLAEDGIARAEGRIHRDGSRFDFSAEGQWIQEGGSITITWAINTLDYVQRFSLLEGNGVLSGVGEYPCCLGWWKLGFSRSRHEA